MSATAWFLDDEPSTRFPVYCRGNVGEIVPWAATPLSSSLTTPAFEAGFTELFASTGAFSAAELAEPAATGGLFGGYLYFNLSFARSFAARLPGIKVSDIDQQMFGSGGGAPPYRRGPGDRNVGTALRGGVGITRSLIKRTPIDLDAGRAETERWIASLPSDPSDADVVAMTAGATERFGGYLRALLESSFGAGISTSLIERLGRRAEEHEPGLLVKAMSGLGTIETARPAVALWRLGRAVAGSRPLTELFDAGVPGLLDRLRASDTEDAVAFLAGFTAFLDEHGHRGPNEVELASDTWATAPDSALAVIERLRLTGEDADPERAAERLAGERERARRRLREQVPRPLRPLLDRLLTTASRGTARREQAKGTLVLGLSGMRRVLLAAADRLVSAGHLPDRRQLFMVTVDELPGFLADPAPLGEELARRRRRYEELNTLVPPFAFEGRIPDPSTWASRSDRPTTPCPESFTGIGVSSGVARGRARVVTDPADPRGIEPGEVLVAPLTDPAWTPLFLAAAGVVVDVGALQSHAAIVARELGIPAVVSVAGASAQIADGVLLEVDGDRGTVRIVAPPS